MTRHDFQPFGWDNYDCIHCNVSGYTAAHTLCEEEAGFSKTYMARKQREAAESVRKVNPLLALINKKKA